MRQPLDPETAELVAERFRALGDPTRLLILDHLGREGEVAVQKIAARVGGSQQNVSKHLSVLRVQRIVAWRKQGTSSLYRIADLGVLRLCEEGFRDQRSAQYNFVHEGQGNRVATRASLERGAG